MSFFMPACLLNFVDNTFFISSAIRGEDADRQMFPEMKPSDGSSNDS